ncbi:hypothetical protein E9549_19445 [Blastococcus sp. MG754426]|uniref:hypothetical protein n=1 Tax=unclassified Blastococcus TaxID=2619396 RepID=UPI001EEFF3FF|nr:MULTISPECIES: hypothetical protein [unclassified Blastococcus]MCF6509552.1 hypothetical protein [Blastococcus sp. MG754426]MCF6512206.1 hypothetical protein [Blastococcus sp. MG754427]MCF6737183.1 hypothetical protein [Blastococcus sp. KM273129]
MHATASPVRKPSAHAPEGADEGLALLSELMVDEPAAAPPAPRPPHPGWTARVQEWTHRASAWGEGPQGAWRAW